MKFWMIVASLLIVSCSSTGRVSNVREASMLINYGDPKERVLDILGTAGDRSFRGEGEAWQYCSTGFSSDTYTTVWFDGGKVTGVTTQNAAIADGFCNLAFPRVDWGQVPADQKIDIDVTTQ